MTSAPGGSRQPSWTGVTEGLSGRDGPAHGPDGAVSPAITSAAPEASRLRAHMGGAMMRVLICGGRDPSPEVCDAVWNWVMENCSHGDVVIHGAARGVDTQAMIAAQTIHGVKHHPFQADWNAHGRAAGPIRNKRMLDEGKPSLVVAFPGGKGTENMVKQAKRRGLDVVYPMGTP